MEVRFIFFLLRGSRFDQDVRDAALDHGCCPWHRIVAFADPAEVRKGLRLGEISVGRLVQTCPPSSCSAPGELPCSSVCRGVATGIVWIQLLPTLRDSPPRHLSTGEVEKGGEQLGILPSV